jgi:hypothetical protein
VESASEESLQEENDEHQPMEVDEDYHDPGMQIILHEDK